MTIEEVKEEIENLFKFNYIKDEDRDAWFWRYFGFNYSSLNTDAKLMTFYIHTFIGKPAPQKYIMNATNPNTTVQYIIALMKDEKDNKTNMG